MWFSDFMGYVELEICYVMMIFYLIDLYSEFLSASFRIKQKCTALWVGNVNSHVVTEKLLSQLFSKYGKLVSVRLLPEKYCAFINYHASEDAANALDKLQVCLDV